MNKRNFSLINEYHNLKTGPSVSRSNPPGQLTSSSNTHFLRPTSKIIAETTNLQPAIKMSAKQSVQCFGKKKNATGQYFYESVENTLGKSF